MFEMDIDVGFLASLTDGANKLNCILIGLLDTDLHVAHTFELSLLERGQRKS